MGTIFKKRDKWWINYTHEGRRIRIPIGSSKELAEKVLHKKLTEIAENKYLDIQREVRIKFKDFTQEYIELHAKHRRSWISGFRNSLRKLEVAFGEKFLHEITPLMIERYKAERKSQPTYKGTLPAGATVNRELACLKSIFTKAVDWGKAKENPVRKVKFFKENNQRTRFLIEEELSRLMVCSSPRLQAVIAIAVNTGMRKSELQNLRWEDINYETGIITLTKTKNGEIRYLPINSVVKRALESLRETFSGYVFVKKDGTPYSVRKSFDTAVRKAGILGFRFHDLRHTFASHLVMSNVDLNTVRELLGHKSLDMTLRYSHLSPNHKQDAVQKLVNRFSAQKVTALPIPISV